MASKFWAISARVRNHCSIDHLRLSVTPFKKMPIYKVNPIDSAFRYMWIGFTGLFISTIGFGFIVHDTSKTILNELSVTGSRTPEIVRGLLVDGLMTPLPMVAGAMVAFFLIMFACSGVLFLLRSIALLAKNDPGR